MLTVDTQGNHTIYSPTLPPGGVAIGTVDRGGGDIGALVLMPATGMYVQCNAGAVRSLDQRAVKRALQGPDTKARNYSIYLDAAQINKIEAIASQTGESVSAIVRRAIEAL